MYPQRLKTNALSAWSKRVRSMFQHFVSLSFISSFYFLSLSLSSNLLFVYLYFNFNKDMRQ